jgi:hypothetical protein
MTKSVRAVGIPWYSRNDYPKLREIFDDGHKLPASFSDWLKGAQRLKDEQERRGIGVVKAHINPHTFPAWCAGRGLNIDASARIEFANLAAYREYGQTH